MNVIDVYFNTTYLNDLINIYNLDLNAYPEYEIRRYKVARAEKSIVTSKEAVQKPIPIYGYICGANRSEIEQNLALLKLAVYGSSGTLKVFQAGQDTIYQATCDDMTEEWNKNTLEVTLNFTANNPYGHELEQTVLNFPNITTSESTFTLIGSSVAPIRPAITLTYNTVTGGTNKTVTIRNAETQIGISITNTFASGDVLSLIHI